jgi:Carboxypeptidase regulatory-like domain
VTAAALCAAPAAPAGRIAALWDEARTALDATRISLRDKLFDADVVRYVRELDPKTRRVIGETSSETRGLVARPFSSMPADSLSALGYWQPDTSGHVLYYGPDADVLLSDAFLHDHCFDMAAADPEHHGLVGLAFAPVHGRRVPDIAGRFWLDDRTFELRSVDFHYDRVAAGVDSAAVGGEVHFAALANGAWIVDRWYVRVPMLGRPSQPLSTEGSAPWILVRPTTLRLSEEGGVVTTDEMRERMPRGSIRGTLRDSSGRRPVAGAQVQLGATSRRVATGRDGEFAFDSVPAGRYTVVAHVPGYDSLGLAAANGEVAVAPGQPASVQLRASEARILTMSLCDGQEAPGGRGTVHVTVTDAAGHPVADVLVMLSWITTVGPVDRTGQRPVMQLATNEAGAATFCAVAADRAIRVLVERPDGTTQSEEEFRIRARAVRHVAVRIPVPR